MGTTYETLLVAADFDATLDALCDLGVVGFVVPLTENRVAVLPPPGENSDTAPVDRIGAELSVALNCMTLAMYVFDSDLVSCYVIRDGEKIHSYFSHTDMLVEWYEENGEMVAELDGVVYPADHEFPKGPRGDDPEVFAPFAVGPPDLDAIAAALRDQGSYAFTMAEDQHYEILEALGLPTGALTTSYWGFFPDKHPGAIELVLDDLD
ncbi:hypothetical protein FHR83_009138 [Actinoplanes campanulatus]|uniref:Uncharacterized protein n=1 Tax=Actinoplanes campanulatus TaxID=113559 RepID=A0A7W5FK47_9ACTN|nr:hypothetical protein [Actinoplanes campanulatus]MBB3101409.1 hypothetical protein [Actinoplanes campanulatus]GGN49524.1 hypothetical protein GCM10010109_87690 [Actinoplanes campanulatus]GID42232.1 hypothetical protein Aca09nite_87380 [Actinoplanes campanulatus]